MEIIACFFGVSWRGQTRYFFLIFTSYLVLWVGRNGNNNNNSSSNNQKILS